MPNSDPEGQIFYPTLTLMIRSYELTHLLFFFVGERVYPSTRLDGITDDDMSVQTTDTDDSLPHSISLPLIEEPESGLETSETSGKKNYFLSYILPTPITDDDMSVQTTDTDDSLPHSISLPLIEEPESGLETSETSGKKNYFLSYILPTPITDDDMSVQTTDTDDSLPLSISLPLIEEPESGLETSETSGK